MHDYMRERYTVNNTNKNLNQENKEGNFSSNEKGKFPKKTAITAGAIVVAGIVATGCGKMFSSQKGNDYVVPSTEISTEVDDHIPYPHNFEENTEDNDNENNDYSQKINNDKIKDRPRDACVYAGPRPNKYKKY